MTQHPPSVLIVDDEPAYRSMLSALLTGAGYATRAACNGAEELLATVQRALERHRLRSDNAVLRHRLADEDTPGTMVGESEGFRSVLALALQVAPSESPVLIQGPTGTGKELLARYMHDRSSRSDDPFVAFNCHWPGNIRELENVLSRAAILYTGPTIEPADLTLKEIERRHILALLRSFGGNKTETARVLGISLKTLYTNLQQYNLPAT